MFFTAFITDQDNAPAIRRQLKKAGFGYVRADKRWVCNPMGLRGARLVLPAIRRIKGIELTKWTTAEFHADLAARVAAA